jgi:preprotein translocase subunit SecE
LPCWAAVSLETDAPSKNSESEGRPVADEQEKASADLPADSGAEELDLEAMGLENVGLTEEEQVAIAAAGARPARKTAVAETVDGKGRATPKRRRSTTTEEQRRTTPVQFVRESVAELRKVVWPTPNQLQQYFIVVLVFVLIMIGIVSVLDLAFGTALLRIFG